MSTTQHEKPSSTRRGLLARPLEALVFLFPLIVFYEVASATRSDRVVAFDLMRQFFELFGTAGMWAPCLGVMAVLLATHIASGERWRVRWGRVGLMYVEAACLAMPLLALNWFIPLSGGESAEPSLIDQVALGVGAGIYEELVFRLVLISVIVMIGVDLIKLRPGPVAMVAIALSSLVFSAHHHPPIGTEPFDVIPFMFRTVAGAYLAIVFWYRGYGPAAGCHAAYNVALTLLGGN